MTSKPKGMIETEHLMMLKEYYDDRLFGLMGEAYGFTPSNTYIDEITGEIFCEFLGSMMEIEKQNKK